MRYPKSRFVVKLVKTRPRSFKFKTKLRLLRIFQSNIYFHRNRIIKKNIFNCIIFKLIMSLLFSQQDISILFYPVNEGDEHLSFCINLSPAFTFFFAFKIYMRRGEPQHVYLKNIIITTERFIAPN